MGTGVEGVWRAVRGGEVRHVVGTWGEEMCRRPQQVSLGWAHGSPHHLGFRRLLLLVVVDLPGYPHVHRVPLASLL